MNMKCKQMESLEKVVRKKHIICGSTMFSSQMRAILLFFLITGLMAAILDFTRKRGFPQGGFGRGFIGGFNNPTESNSVEIPLLTFLSISNGPRSLHCLD